MNESDDPHGPGRHLLGPHAVGRRVVVRRVLPGRTGPTGGPALTDLLGDLVAWPEPGTPPDQRYAVVLGADGTRTAIPLSEIVSGKPIPPRPSPRLRVSAREAHRHALALWPAADDGSLGEWLLRSDPAPAPRHRGPANSCLALGDPGLTLAEAAEAVRDFYAARGCEPLAEVEVGSPAEAGLAGLGWEEVGGLSADFLIASVAQARRAVRRRAEPAGAPGAPWREGTGPGLRAGLGAPGEPDATVRAAVDGDWVGIDGLRVAPGLRRRGLGTLLAGEVLDWAAERGATTAWARLPAEQSAARALHQRLGFVVHHATRHLRAPAG